jgi:hypothetical protein
LFWADAGGVRAASLSGGAVRTVKTSTTATRLTLTPTKIYYTGGRFIYSLPKPGGAASTFIIANTDVTDLYVQNSGTATLFWGQMDNQVRSIPLTGGASRTYQSSTTGRNITSISHDGSRVLYTSCSNGNDCWTVKQSGATRVVVAMKRVGSHDVQGDSTAMYWVDVQGVMRYQH